ncbi:MAG: type II toxin-antitoxin system death-on-curing family toxin [Burkholderiales bacterium]
MREPVWILDEIVPAIHQRQLAEHGGGTGIRDAGLLASALAKPRQLFADGGADVTLPQLAASYAAGIAHNHPFVDGNKRTAFVVCLLFLRENGFDVEASQEEKYEAFLQLAAGSLPEAQLAEWLKKRLKRRRRSKAT